MSLVDRLGKISRRSGLVASAALVGTLVAGKMAPTQNTADTTQPPPQVQTITQPRNTYSETTFNQQYGRLFDISGTQQAVQGAKQAIWQMSGTPEGKKLLGDLGASQTPTKISFSSQMDGTSYGSANPKKEGFPVELNENLTKDNTKLTTTLFHELCHVRQYQQGVGRLSDLPEQKYDLSMAQEAEARFQTSLMASHLPDAPTNANGNAWMDKSLAVDGPVYDSVRNGLTAQDNTLSPEQVDKRAKEEVLKSMVSGKNTETVNNLVPEQTRQQFEATNQEWLHTYNMVAAAHAYDDAYPTMKHDGKRASELVGDISERLGVDKESLLSPTGTDLTNVQKDPSGNILSGSRVSRDTQENQGSIQCTYDSQDRPVNMAELGPDGSTKSDRTYSYSAGKLPTQMQKKTPNGKTTVTYESNGTRSMEVNENENGKTTTYYEAGQRTRETEQNAYGTAETTFKDGKKSDYIYKANDGTVIDEYHQSSVQPPHIPSADSSRSSSTTQTPSLPLQKGVSR